MKIEVFVYQRPNMFKVQENLFNLAGYSELKNLFSIIGYKTECKSLTLFYPERFLNIIEQRVLIHRARKSGFKEIQIVTSSVYIIQTVSREDIQIVKTGNIIEETLEDVKLSVDKAGMPSDGGLTVL